MNDRYDDREEQRDNERVDATTGEVSSCDPSPITFEAKSSTETKDLYAALVKAQAAARNVPKDGHNKFHKYKYARAEDIIEESKGALATGDLGFFAIHWDLGGKRFDRAKRGDKPLTVAGRIYVTYRLVHVSGQWLEVCMSTPVVVESGRPEDKSEQAALTANLSYTLRSLLLLPRDDDRHGVDSRDDRGRDDGRDDDRSGYRDDDSREDDQKRNDEPTARKTDPSHGRGGSRGDGERPREEDRNSKSGDQLIDQYIEQMKKLEVDFGYGNTEERQRILKEHYAMVDNIKGIKVDRDSLQKAIDVWNPIAKSMRAALGISEPTQAQR